MLRCISSSIPPSTHTISKCFNAAALPTTSTAACVFGPILILILRLNSSRFFFLLQHLLSSRELFPACPVKLVSDCCAFDPAPFFSVAAEGEGGMETIKDPQPSPVFLS